MIKDYLLFVLRQMEDIQNEGEYMEFDEIYDKLQFAIDELDVVLDMIDMDMIVERKFEK
jgi:hypothetical protein